LLHVKKEVVVLGGKAIIPEGVELLKYLNDGYAVCNECGAVMDRVEDPGGGGVAYACPSCGWEVDEAEYEYEPGEETEWTSVMLGIYADDVPPAGCRACGGPYPHCKMSCKLFDD
jgi:predicted RNA-binding Zn-ribbon protein involved in translation (DUF1610 family)